MSSPKRLTVDHYAAYCDAVQRTLGRLVVEAHSTPQVDALQLLATGKTPEEIAQSLGVPVKKAQDYISTMVETLDAKSPAHAVAEGIRLGMIDPAPRKRGRRRKR